MRTFPVIKVLVGGVIVTISMEVIERPCDNAILRGPQIIETIDPETGKFKTVGTVDYSSPAKLSET